MNGAYLGSALIYPNKTLIAAVKHNISAISFMVSLICRKQIEKNNRFKFVEIAKHCYLSVAAFLVEPNFDLYHKKVAAIVLV